MTLEEALKMLDAIPRRMDSATVGALSTEQGKESLACRQYRFAMNRSLRTLAREVSNDQEISDLEYNMIMSHAGFEAVRILCQLQIAERDA